MAELPASFGLTAQKDTQTGKTVITGKRDDGSDYTVRTVDAVTPEVVADIAASDRERTNAREFVNRFMEDKAAHDRAYEEQMTNEFFEATEEIMRGAWRSEKIGYSRRYAQNYDQVFGG